MEAREILTNWIKEFIINLNICPFAATPWNSGEIALYECNATNPQAVVSHFAQTIFKFDDSAKTTSALWFYPELKMSYLDFNDFSEDFENILLDNHMDEKYQLVVFHPDFYFAGMENDEMANLVNCSPYPMIHCILSSEIEKVINSDDDGEKISMGNEKKLNSMDLNELKRILHFKQL